MVFNLGLPVATSVGIVWCFLDDTEVCSIRDNLLWMVTNVVENLAILALFNLGTRDRRCQPGHMQLEVHTVIREEQDFLPIVGC